MEVFGGKQFYYFGKHALIGELLKIRKMKRGTIM